ncbi:MULTISPECIES: hypothetical protein [Flavobacterium]|uniref:Uncharacterized protein n=1 Tax=Flavobacterium gyeonganense TaxID=1310418 RepID=A0ABV5HD07_9FLAO|nr:MULTISPECIES: hypothetical protein [Flavobacterium]MBZ4041052.1 hypothetical protein [Flavobacterium hibisci]
MENSNTYNSTAYSTESLHSQICLADNIDFIYRKAYRGDWGHWDDLPDTTTTTLDCPGKNSEINSIGLRRVPNENSYL